MPLQPQHRSDLKHGFPLYRAITLLVLLTELPETSEDQGQRMSPGLYDVTRRTSEVFRNSGDVIFSSGLCMRKGPRVTKDDPKYAKIDKWAAKRLKTIKSKMCIFFFSSSKHKFNIQYKFSCEVSQH